MNRGANWIVDHCEGWYATDEAFDLSGNENGPYGNVTVSNCLIGESKTGIIMGGIWQGQTNWNDPYGGISVLNNTFINVSHRFPKAGGAFQMDVINNVIHNWQWRLIRNDPDNYTLNEINNYYQSGVNTTSNFNKTWCRNWMNPQIYTSGNFISSNIKPVGYDLDNSIGWNEFNDMVYPIQSSWFINTPHPYQGVSPNVKTALAAKSYALNESGSRKYLNADGTVCRNLY